MKSSQVAGVMKVGRFHFAENVAEFWDRRDDVRCYNAFDLRKILFIRNGGFW